MSKKGPISYLPTDGLTYDPEDEKYWNEESLQKEITRVFEICHGCRMCFKYCDSFPNLFKFIDENHDGDVTKISVLETQNVMDNCFQCKLCEVQCPYTPRDKHEFLLDFPKLVHRYRAIKTKKEGVPFKDKIISNADQAGLFSRLSLGMANVMNRVKVHRIFLEKLMGIHRDKLLPEFAKTTFEKLAKKLNKIKKPDPEIEVVLFQTCYVQNNEPQIGRDTLDVFEKNKVNIACVEGLACCGMPSWEHGDLETLRKNAKINLDKLTPYVEKGAKIIGINPTCTMMLRNEYPGLVAKEDREQAKKCAEAVMETSEFLWSIRKEERFNTEFKSTPGDSVAYHSPCHLRAQAVGFKGRDLLRKIPGVTAKSVMECCGHDGTFAMKKETFEASIKVGKKSFEGMKEAESEVWSTECPLAALQFSQHAGVKPLHPMSILAKAYRENGFKTKIKKDDDK